jgi:hypothetical protein
MKEIWGLVRQPKSWTLEKLGCHICSRLWQPAGASSPARRCKIISRGCQGLNHLVTPFLLTRSRKSARG